ncbi:MAG: Efflux ABC transporter, permease/ATP-binding protein [uncultured Cytophagales bacterium]|uniref:Efflux ABC transporter, permease/ATP-binding protein n=1 Tax=uncultured Cytophagales bacterium TaxID=158755 RepID=A0A6J4LP23_9SPHI|nr:MAG: Efflux ABC transporter, permease/ATP-binding protein [uncultured Cytophagales bacterium]
MKILLRLLTYARPIGKFAVPFAIATVFAILFGIINFTLIIPLLDVLFGTVGETQAQQILQKPEPALSFDFFKQFFNYYFGQIIREHGKMGALKFVCAVIFVSVLLSNLFRYLAQRTLEHFRAYTVCNFRQDAFDKAIALDLSYYANERKGNVMSRLTNDVQEVESAISSVFNAVFKEPVSLVAYFVFLFAMSVQLTMFTLVIIPVSGLIIGGISKRLKGQAREVQASLGTLLSILDETFGGIRIIAGFNAFGYIRGKFGQENEHYREALRRFANRRELASPFSEFAGVSVVAGILLYGGSLVLSGEFGAASFIAYIILFSQVLRPIKEISNSFSQLQRGIAAGRRVFELIDTVPAIQSKPGAVWKNAFERDIEFRNVSFGYLPGTKTLQHISFSLPKGKSVALVGESGGGKSTIADLLTRFYDPTEGGILIDGVDLRDCNLDSLRQHLGIVTQESILFNDTIFNNIAFGDPAATQAQVEQAARIANAHEFILRTENGYQTNIGDRGMKLSGGQRQRLAIARAVYKNPPILILDEATSALDTESEKLVQEALANLMKGRTTLVIAHRLSTIQKADEILVIKDGRIVERGNHEELLEVSNGIYRKLSLLQAI